MLRASKIGNGGDGDDDRKKTTNETTNPIITRHTPCDEMKEEVGGGGATRTSTTIPAHVTTTTATATATATITTPLVVAVVAPLSKNRQKKLAKLERTKKRKLERKEHEKARKREQAKRDGRDLEHERHIMIQNTQAGHRQHRLNALWDTKLQQAQHRFEICIDLGGRTTTTTPTPTAAGRLSNFEAAMTEKERASLAQQIRYCYSYNKRSPNPIVVAVTGLSQSPTMHTTTTNNTTTTTNNNTDVGVDIKIGTTCSSSNSSSSTGKTQDSTGECSNTAPTVAAALTSTSTTATTAEEITVRTVLERETGYPEWPRRGFVCTEKSLEDYYGLVVVTAGEEEEEKAKEDIVIRSKKKQNDSATTENSNATTTNAAAATTANITNTDSDGDNTTQGDGKGRGEGKKTAEGTACWLSSTLKTGTNKNIVYLTSDSSTTLQTLDDNTIYVIGGIVDRNRLKHATKNRAENELYNLPTAKLPLVDYYLSKTSKRNNMNITKESQSQANCGGGVNKHNIPLTVNHVFNIMLKYKQYNNDWERAFQEVLPHRGTTPTMSNK